MKLETRNSKPLLLGHRGARPTSPLSRSAGLPAENTLPAFEYALSHGCDGFEFDVRATQDGRLVICHDPEMCGLQVASTTYDNLCSAAGVLLPCLPEVLALFADRAYLDIELKAPGYEPAVLDALRRCAPARGYVLSSFLPHILLQLHELDASLPLGFLCDRPAYSHLWRELPVRMFIPEHQLISQALVSEVHDTGLQLFTWTVNQPSDMLRLAQWGVDGLISDDPKLLSETFPPLSSSTE